MLLCWVSLCQSLATAAGIGKWKMRKKEWKPETIDTITFGQLLLFFIKNFKIYRFLFTTGNVDWSVTMANTLRLPLKTKTLYIAWYTKNILKLFFNFYDKTFERMKEFPWGAATLTMMALSRIPLSIQSFAVIILSVTVAFGRTASAHHSAECHD